MSCIWSAPVAAAATRSIRTVRIVKAAFLSMVTGTVLKKEDGGARRAPPLFYLIPRPPGRWGVEWAEYHRKARASAIWTALRAAPFRRLSETTHIMSPFSLMVSLLTLPTKTGSRPWEPLAVG